MAGKAPPPPDFGKILQQARKALGSFGNLGVMPFLVGFTGIGVYTLYKGIYFVQGGYRAIKFNAITGLSDTTFGEGANLCIPYIETPILFDVRSRPTEITTSSGSRDLQIINMAVRVLYRPNIENLSDVYRRLGVNYADTVLPSIINEVIKSVIAQYNASELLVKRPEVSNKIAVSLSHRARQFNIDVSDVSITQMTFGKEYTQAVEAKQISQQMAERAKFTVEQAMQEKLGAIILAEGEAESARLIGTSLKSNPGFLELRRLEAAKVIARSLAQSKNKAFIPSESLMLNFAEAKVATK